MNQEKFLKIIKKNFINGESKFFQINNFINNTFIEVDKEILSKEYSQILDTLILNNKNTKKPLFYEFDGKLFLIGTKIEENIFKKFNKITARNTLEVCSSSQKSKYRILPYWMFTTNIKTIKGLNKIIKKNLPLIINKTKIELKNSKQHSGQTKNKQYFSSFEKYGIIEKKNNVFKMTERGIKLSNIENISIADIFNTPEMLSYIKSNYNNIVNNLSLIFNKYISIEEFLNKLYYSYDDTEIKIKEKELDIDINWFIALVIADKELSIFLQLTSIEKIFEVVKKVMVENEKYTWPIKPGESIPMKTILDMMEVMKFFSNLESTKMNNNYLSGKTIFKGGVWTFVRNNNLANLIKREADFSCQSCLKIPFIGKDGNGFVESHHMIPLHNLIIKNRHKLDIKENLIALCPNCHRSAHKQKREPIPMVMFKMFDKLSSQIKRSNNISSIESFMQKYLLK